MSKKKKNYLEIIDQGKELVDFYMANPCKAVHDLLDVDLAPIQRLVFKDMWFKDYVIVVAGRGFGKTYLDGTLASLSCLLKPGFRVGLMSPSFRQCLSLSDNTSTFWTSGGLVTGTNSFYNSINTDNTTIQSLFKQNAIINKWINEEQSCIRLNIEKGIDISGSEDHKIQVCDNNLNLYYKSLKNVVNDDWVVIKKGFNFFSNNSKIDIGALPQYSNSSIKRINLPDELDNSLAYMLGLLCGDGYIEGESVKHKTYRVSYCSADIELINIFKDIIFKKFGLITNERKIGSLYVVDINSIVLWEYIKLLGLPNSTAKNKIVPAIIKSSSKANVVCFLQGLFDTDGSCSISTTKNNKSGEVNLVSTSKVLCKEVQSILLNIGILSTFSLKYKKAVKYFKNREKSYSCSNCYRIRITGTNNLRLFFENVGFRLTRKNNILNEYLDSTTKEDFNSVIPNTFECVCTLAKECFELDGANIEFLSFYLNKYKKYRKTNFTLLRISELLNYAEQLNIKSDSYYKLNNVVSLDITFLKVKSKEFFKDKTIDIEVSNESCYWVNGLINHNSKMVFSEVEKLYAKSSILREACERPPVRGTDSCYLRFKSVGGRPPSFIEAVPLGNDGSKIRGSRFYLIIVDELAQVPTEIVDLVIRPFGATSNSPMERVRRLEHQQKLIDAGLATPDDFEKEMVNKMVMTSSGYYKFNHMWRRMKDYWCQMDIAEANGEESPYSVWQVPYWDLPEGFLDTNNIQEAQRIMSKAEFQMEYEAAMVSDSEGFFKASLVEQCIMGSGHTVELSGSSDGQYILGVDPNQGGKASTGVVVIKIGPTSRLTSVLELKNNTTQQLTMAIQDLCTRFNVVRIFMDKGGGGKAICDLLEEGYNEFEPIIDRTNPDHKGLEGKHILDMVNFTPAWIAEANFTTKSLLEDKKLLLPEVPISSLEDSVSKRYDAVNTLKSQLLNIVVTQTATGVLHFDTPSKGQNKDLYSAFILGGYGIRALEKEFDFDDTPLIHTFGGLVRPHSNGIGGSFNSVGAAYSGGLISSDALLKKRVK